MNIEKAAENLIKRGFMVSRFKNKTEAADYLVSSIENTTIGMGGSMTLKTMGIYERLMQKNDVYWHGLNRSREIEMNGINAKVYLTSANAIAETGEIINIDGTGNRVAATLYNKEKVYFIVGKNKFADDFESALWRARNVAAPKNAQRLGKKVPCAVKGDKCYDCASGPERTCNALVVLWGKTRGVGEIEVVIIDEELGF